MSTVTEANGIHMHAIPEFVSVLPLRVIAAFAVAVLVQGCPSSPSGGGQAQPGEAPRATTFSKSFGGAGFDMANAAIGASDGGYAFVGALDGEPLRGDYSKLWINKLDANGNTQWQRTLGGSAPGTVGAEAGVMRRVRPTPDGGSIIVGHALTRSSDFDASDQSWGGDCAFAGKQRRLRLTMDANKQCTVTFAPTAPQRFALTVQKAGFAALVVSAPSGIDCGSTCTDEFNSGQTVRLTATPAAPGGTVSGWTGCDRIVTGTNGMPDCEVDMSAAITVQVRIE
jgi:hypothetical protein